MTETMEILDKVNSFYSGAWSQLLLFTIAAISIVGVVVPMILHFMQSRTLKNEMQSLENMIELRIDGIREEVIERIKEEIDTEIQTYKKDLAKGVAKAEGGVFHLQGNRFVEQEEVMGATYSLALAADKYLTAGDECNLRRVLTVLVEYCLPKLNQQSMTDESMNNEEVLCTLIESLSITNENGRYTDVISNVKRGMKLAYNNNPNKSINQTLAETPGF